MKRIILGSNSPRRRELLAGLDIDFTVDTGNSRRLRAMIPKDVLFVSESGVKDAADVRAAREMGADAVLVGEALMRAPDKRAKLKQLRGEGL